MTVKVGVIGLGVSGRPVAGRLLKAGFEVAVYDVREEPLAALQAAGATACLSSAEVARRSEIIISLVRDRAQTDDVVCGANGIIHTVAPDSIFVTGSTLGPAPVRRIAEALAARGCATLDMPFTGGRLAAYDGTLSLMIGGAQETLDRALPVLRAFAQTITRAGGIGAGQAAKLAHQLTMGMNVLALLEGLSLAAAAGVEPAVMKQIIGDGIANSGALKIWDDLGPRWKVMLEAAPPGAEIPNLRKDLHLALELAQELGIDLHLGAQASRIADSGIATGHDNPLL